MATVLVVDDLAAHRQLTGVLLARESGWKVVYARSGIDALEKLATEPVDLILTDLLMPEMNGLELLRAVRRDHPQIPVILMTASGSEYIAVQALQEGAASYVPKRGLARRLADTLKTVLAASRAQRAHVDLDRRLTCQQFDFVLENDAALVLALPPYLNPHMDGAGLRDNLTCLRTHIALEEALVNALYHGNLEVSSEFHEQKNDEFCKLASARAEQVPYRDRRIHVHAVFTRSEARFTIRDEGRGFDPSTLPDPTDVTNLDRPHGRGIMLMRTFMDEVRFNESGNEVTLVKRSNSLKHEPDQDPVTINELLEP